MRPAFLTVAVGAAGRVLCAHFERRSSAELVLHAWRFVSPGFPAGSAADPFEEWSRALEILGRDPNCRAALHVSLPPSLALVRRLHMPRFPAAQRSKLVAFEVGQLLGLPATEATWTLAELPGVDGEGLMQIAAAGSERLERWATPSAALGGVDSMEPGCLALYRSFCYSAPEVAAPYGLIEGHSRGLRVLVAEGAGYATRHAVWPAGSSGTTAPWGTTQPSSPEALAERAHLELARLLASPEVSGGKVRPVLGSVHVAGEWAALPGFCATLARRLGVAVEPFDPLRRVDVKGPRPSPAESAGFAEAVGLAARGLVAGPELELMPLTAVARRNRRRRRPVIAALFAALVLVPVPPLVALLYRADALSRLRAEVSAELVPLEGWEQAIGQAREHRDRLTAEREGWMNVRRSQAAWPGFLADLEARLSEIAGLGCEALRIEWGEKPGQSPVLHLAGAWLRTSVESDPQAVREMLARLKESPYVERLDTERFDDGDPTRLRFEITASLRPESWLP